MCSLGEEGAPNALSVVSATITGITDALDFSSAYKEASKLLIDRETGYLLPPDKQIRENGITPGSAHASLFQCQGSLASFLVGIHRVFAFLERDSSVNVARIICL